MDDKHRAILQECFAYIIKHIHNVENICDELVSAEILTSGMFESIKYKTPKPTAQIRELLSILPRRGKDAYTCFIAALRKTENNGVADHLEQKEDPVRFTDSNKRKLKNSSDETQEAKRSYGEKGDISKKSDAAPIATDWPDFKNGCKQVQKNHFVKKTAMDLKHNLEREKIYYLAGSKKGNVIVISNVNVSESEKSGSVDCSDGKTESKDIILENKCTGKIDFDKTTMHQLFKYMEFNVERPWTDLTKEEIKEKLRTVASDFDSLVVVILSAGKSYEADQIYDKNGVKVDREEIFKIIRESPAFKGKPKLVILRTYNFKENKDIHDELDAAKCTLQLPTANNDDFFVVTAVPKIKHGPWMMGQNMDGSYFIQALAHVFTRHAYTKSFLDLMEEVNNCLHTAMVPESKDDTIGKRTVVAEVSILEFSSNKKLYFFPSEVIEFWPNLKKGRETIKKTHIKMSTEDILEKILASTKVYHMTGNEKGKVIIISNVKCGKNGNCRSLCGETQSKSSNLDAQTNQRNDICEHCKSSVDFDLTNIQQLFQLMKFKKPISWKNIDKEEIKKRLLALDDATFNSLIVVILSGGQFDDVQQIYDTNGEKVEREEVLQILRESSAFKGKPKVVIFTTYNFKENNTEKGTFSQDAEKSSISISPNKDDLFVVTAVQKTKNGPWIIGDNVSGSYFIQALVHVFKQHAHDTSFLDLMEEVNYSLQTALVPTPLPTPLEGRKFSDDGKPTPVAEVVLLELATEKALYLFPGLDKISSKTEESETLKSESGNPVTPVVGNHVTCTENHPVGESTPNVTETAKDSDEPTSGKSVEQSSQVTKTL